MAFIIFLAVILLAVIGYVLFSTLRSKGKAIKAKDIDKFEYNKPNLYMYQKYMQRIADSKFSLMSPEDWEWVREFERRNGKELVNEEKNTGSN